MTQSTEYLETLNIAKIHRKVIVYQMIFTLWQTGNFLDKNKRKVDSIKKYSSFKSN